MLRALPFWLALVLVLGFMPHAAAQSSSAIPLVSLPFELVGGIIVLRNLTFNGRQGDFLLDTGCTYPLVIEQSAFPSQLRPSKLPGLSAAGPTDQYELPVTQFAFGDVRPPQVAQATSLASLRAILGPRLLGIIGTGLLRRFEVVIDYAHRRLTCYALGPQQSAKRPFLRSDSVAFTLEKGYPVAVAYLGTTPVHLLLDTGARENGLDSDLARRLPTFVHATGTPAVTVTGLAGQLTATRARVARLVLGTTEWREVPVLLTPPVRYHSGRALPFQGILGSTFFGQEPLISFHFGHQRLYVLAPRGRH